MFDNPESIAGCLGVCFKLSCGRFSVSDIYVGLLLKGGGKGLDRCRRPNMSSYYCSRVSSGERRLPLQ